ncbi:hypothetical protein CRG98_014607 [Punica granatum]|uniref:Uncharacterized protein n=1 Tax=Punica granatum TaxID=22663 RepID=A0A2I0K8Z9_PUNGR|nr:hypothetical protein CRG98_014607 [Punica granatum]
MPNSWMREKHKNSGNNLNRGKETGYNPKNQQRAHGHLPSKGNHPNGSYRPDWSCFDPTEHLRENGSIQTARAASRRRLNCFGKLRGCLTSPQWFQEGCTLYGPECELSSGPACARPNHPAWECPPSRGCVTDTSEKESLLIILRPEDRGPISYLGLGV